MLFWDFYHFQSVFFSKKQIDIKLTGSTNIPECLIDNVLEAFCLMTIFTLKLHNVNKWGGKVQKLNIYTGLKYIVQLPLRNLTFVVANYEVCYKGFDVKQLFAHFCFYLHFTRCST